jgi:hypothetical protein
VPLHLLEKGIQLLILPVRHLVGGVDIISMVFIRQVHNRNERVDVTAILLIQPDLNLFLFIQAIKCVRQRRERGQIVTK